MALASRKDLMRILTQPAQRKGLHHNLIDLLIDPLVSMHLLNEKMHALDEQIKCVHRQNLKYHKMLAVHIKIT